MLPRSRLTQRFCRNLSNSERPSLITRALVECACLRQPTPGQINQRPADDDRSADVLVDVLVPSGGVNAEAEKNVRAPSPVVLRACFSFGGDFRAGSKQWLPPNRLLA